MLKSLFKKRLFALFIVLSMMSSLLPVNSTTAETISPENLKTDIFSSLSEYYNVGINYLQLKQEIWTDLIKAAANDMDYAKEAKDFWIDFISRDFSRSFAISSFYLENYNKPISSFPEMYETLFYPLYNKSGINQQGFQTACVTFLYMVFYGGNAWRDELLVQKENIKLLQQFQPDDEYLSAFKSFYKECLQLQDYIQDSTDDYNQSKEQLRIFEKRRRELKSEFDFDFAWRDLNSSYHAAMEEPFLTLLHPTEEAIYQRALTHEYEDQYRLALTEYRLIRNYKNSNDRIEAISEALYNQALSLEADGQTSDAASLFRLLSGYKDSESHLTNISGSSLYPITINGFQAINGPFFSGLTGVQNTDGKWGFINTKGQLVIPCQFDKVGDFYRGYTTVTVNQNDTIQKGVISPTGDFIIPLGQYDDVGSFSEGLCAVKKGDKWGFVDKNGQIVISPAYDKASFFQEGLASVQIDKMWGAIDRNGKMVIKPAFGWSFVFYDGVATVYDGGKFCYINTAGTRLFDTQFRSNSRFSEGLSLCTTEYDATKKAYLYKYIDLSGQVVLNLGTKYKQLGNFQEGLAYVERDGHLGFIDRAGNEIITPEYQSFKWVLSGFKDGCVAAQKDDTWGIIDKTNQIVIPLMYDDAASYNEGYCLVIKDDTITIFDELALPVSPN